jgi:CheY-like chemotaxis protein
MPRAHAATVLVVEDNCIVQDLIQEVLEEEGYRVLRAADGVHGFHLATADQPDVILLDMGIPPASGVDLLARLRDQHATSRIPVVALTGIRRPVDTGPDGLAGWIEKPFDLDVLLEHVGQLARVEA